MIVFSARLWASRHFERSSAFGIVDLSPLTTIAFRFFAPATAPVPPRPAARSSSLMIAAKSTPFSPACPIAMTERSSP